ncbi:MAG: vitamin K epoxide reductase family protein [Acidimicrobiales bacterium]
MPLALVGVAVSAYLTVAHYSTTAVLACSDKGVVNCAKVTTSSYSVVAGIPVAVLGLVFFVAMVGLQTPFAWRSPRADVRIVRLALASTGAAAVVWLIYVELFRLDAICLYCTIVHLLAVALFVQTGLGTAATAPGAGPAEWEPGDAVDVVIGSAP